MENKKIDSGKNNLEFKEKYSIRHLSELISTGSLSPVELIESTLERINHYNFDLRAFITVLDDSARKEAVIAEQEIKSGNYRGPLHGIPISLKDLIYCKNVKSTSGSKILADFVPNYDATVVTKLKEAGAIIIGMNNTHEFACGLTNINSHYGSSKNPWDVNRISGGSSGGSAVAVSAQLSVASLGTDTSGSIRVPSSLCGLFGLKPTYGRVSKYGMMPLAPSIDHIGPIARTPWDIACILQVIAGKDKNDETTQDITVPNYLKNISNETRNFKIGIPKQYFFDLIDPKVQKNFEKLKDNLNRCGIETASVDVENTEKIFDVWKALRLGESAATHQKWIKTRPQDYEEQVITMLKKGLEVTAVEYISAHQTRKEIRESFLSAMKNFDALLVPTTIIPAPFLEQTVVKINGKEVGVYEALSRLTTAFTVTGLPVLNIPAGLVDDRLPVGAQLIGRPFEEETLLSIGNKYELEYRISETMVPDSIYNEPLLSSS